MVYLQLISVVDHGSDKHDAYGDGERAARQPRRHDIDEHRNEREVGDKQQAGMAQRGAGKSENAPKQPKRARSREHEEIAVRNLARGDADTAIEIDPFVRLENQAVSGPEIYKRCRDAEQQYSYSKVGTGHAVDVTHRRNAITAQC